MPLLPRHAFDFQAFEAFDGGGRFGEADLNRSAARRSRKQKRTGLVSRWQFEQVLSECKLGLAPDEIADLGAALSPPEERAAHPWGGGAVAYGTLFRLAELGDDEMDALGLQLARRVWMLRAEGVEFEASLSATDISRRGVVTRSELEDLSRRLGLPLTPEELAALATRFSRLQSVLSDEIMYGDMLQVRASTLELRPLAALHCCFSSSVFSHNRVSLFSLLSLTSAPCHARA